MEAADAALGLAEAVDDAQIIPEHRRRKPRKKRDEKLPEHLPRYEVTAEASDEMKSCPTHGERTLLPESMWDRTETLEFEPPKLKVRVTKYPKYACRRTIPSAASLRPNVRPESWKATSTTRASRPRSLPASTVITYRFIDCRITSPGAAGHRRGARSATSWRMFTSSFGPLLEFFRRTVQSDSAVGCDDTGVTLLYPKTIPKFDVNDPKQRRIQEVFEEALKNNKPSINAKMWAYRGVTIPLNVFDFTVSRHRDGPELFFADYEGTLLGDCWHGFESISAPHRKVASCVPLATATHVASSSSRHRIRTTGRCGCVGTSNCTTSRIGASPCPPRNV